jgi:hypothetical protein
MSRTMTARAAAALDAWYSNPGGDYRAPGVTWSAGELADMHAALEAPTVDDALQALGAAPDPVLSTPEQDAANRAALTALREWCRPRCSGYRHLVTSPRIDPAIPELMTVAEAAALLETTSTWISRLVGTGELPGLTVGKVTVLPAADMRALEQARRDGQAGWIPPGEPTKIPALVTTGQLAEIVGFVQRNWPGALFRRGDLPGVLVGGRYVLFRRQLAETFAQLRQQGYTRWPDDVPEATAETVTANHAEHGGEPDPASRFADVRKVR